jgi:preprotein translocase subunit SecB
MCEDMSQNIQYPFSLVNAFFISLHFEREGVMPDTIEMPIEMQIKVIDKDFPRLQVNLRNKTNAPSPVKLDIELVGLFDYIGDHPEQDHELISDFIREKGLYMLWPYVSQMTRMITGQMGMNPIDTRTPLSFELLPIIEAAKADASDQES